MYSMYVKYVFLVQYMLQNVDTLSDIVGPSGNFLGPSVVLHEFQLMLLMFCTELMYL